MFKWHTVASGPITSRQIDGETVETVADFIFLGSKITADGDYSHEIKWCLLFWRKVMINLDSILKSRDITLPTKVRLVKAIVFPVVMYGCAAAAKLLQSCPTLCDPTDSSPPGSPAPGILQGIVLIQRSNPHPMHWLLLSRFSRVRLCATP